MIDNLQIEQIPSLLEGYIILFYNFIKKLEYLNLKLITAR